MEEIKDCPGCKMLSPKIHDRGCKKEFLDAIVISKAHRKRINEEFESLWHTHPERREG